jgi:C4-dicarboxylate transporter DctQ subunit
LNGNFLTYHLLRKKIFIQSLPFIFLSGSTHRKDKIYKKDNKIMLLKILDHLEEWLITLLMGAATILIFVAVLHRYLSGWAIPGVQDYLLSINMSWAQELCIIMFVWMAKFGAAYGVRTGIHVGVDVLINRLSDRNRAKLIIFGLLAGALFTGTIGTLGAQLIWENGMHYALINALGWDTGDIPEGPVTPDLEWPTWLVYSAIPLGSYLMCFRFLQVTYNFILTGTLPHYDHTYVEDAARPEDINWFEMDDELHPHDIKHHHDNKGD